MQNEDIIRLRHMLDAANEAVEFASGKKREDLDKNRMLTLSIIKSIEIIGEAASKISETLKNDSADTIPWLDIINMRHRLIHNHFDVNIDVVWQTVKGDLPDLIILLEEIIPFD